MRPLRATAPRILPEAPLEPRWLPGRGGRSRGADKRRWPTVADAAPIASRGRQRARAAVGAVGTRHRPGAEVLGDARDRPIVVLGVCETRASKGAERTAHQGSTSPSMDAQAALGSIRAVRDRHRRNRRRVARAVLTPSQPRKREGSGHRGGYRGGWGRPAGATAEGGRLPGAIAREPPARGRSDRPGAESAAQPAAPPNGPQPSVTARVDTARDGRYRRPIVIKRIFLFPGPA